jgi:hypothetical protein
MHLSFDSKEKGSLAISYHLPAYLFRSTDETTDKFFCALRDVNNAIIISIVIVFFMMVFFHAKLFKNQALFSLFPEYLQ